MLSDWQQACRTGSYSVTSCARADAGSITLARTNDGTRCFNKSSRIRAARALEDPNLDTASRGPGSQVLLELVGDVELQRSCALRAVDRPELRARRDVRIGVVPPHEVEGVQRIDPDVQPVGADRERPRQRERLGLLGEA